MKNTMRWGWFVAYGASDRQENQYPRDWIFSLRSGSRFSGARRSTGRTTIGSMSLYLFNFDVRSATMSGRASARLTNSCGSVLRSYSSTTSSGFDEDDRDFDA